MGELFRASRVKLANALQYIDEVDAGLKAFDSDNPTSVKVTWTGAMEFNRKEVPPATLSKLGDALHNMRAALDLMSTELARINGKSYKSVRFPFADSEVGFDDMIKESNFKRAGEDAVALLKTFKPYTGGNQKLRAIHDLDIRDKHIDILTTRVDANNFQFSYVRGQDPNIPIPVSASYSHKFLDGPLAGLPLIETLKELVKLVDGIIEAFDSLVVKRKAV